MTQPVAPAGGHALLVSKRFAAIAGADFAALARRLGADVGIVHLPDAQGLVAADVAARITCAFVDREIRFHPFHWTRFGETVTAAPHFQWLHLVSSGHNQHPYVPPLLARGAAVTTSTGANAEPVALTAFTALLMLARNFPQWLAGQRAREWRPMRGDAVPADLRGQTIVIVGMGSIGCKLATLCRMVGMKVIGVRRSPLRPDDPVDELHPPQALDALWPRAQWVALTCPLTAQTRDLVDAPMLARLPRGARVINVSRGEVVVDAALIDALRSGQLAAAFTDVYRQEPLPADSPWWDAPNLVMSPHNASASKGNDRRTADIFLRNFEHWWRGEPLENRVAAR